MASVVKRHASRPKWFWLASLLGCTPGFKKSRCKKLLKVTMSRIKLLRGRREVQVRQLRRDLAQLLQLGQEENAESRLDRLWKEHSLLSAYIKIGEYCQLVKANLRNIAGQRECPMDLKESLASLCFAASCCADLPELQEIRDIMVLKYGKEFLTSAHELLPGEHVNKLFLEAFSTKQPLEVSKKALLKSIVAEYNVVQPKKPKLLGTHGSSQKVASSDCNNAHKQQLRHEYGSNAESHKQDPKLNALDQEEEHKKTLEQIKHATSIPTWGAFMEEDTSSPHERGDRDRKTVGRQKKEQKDSHSQVDMVQEGVNETDLGSQDRLLEALPPDRHGKEKVKNRVKASKKNAGVNQAGQEGQLYSSNRMSTREKSKPDEAATVVTNGLHVYGNTASGKLSLEKEVKGFVSGQHWSHEHGDFCGHAKHRENELSNKECLADNKHQACIAQPQKHGYHDEALSENCSSHQMSQQGNLYYKKNDYADRERSNGAVRPERVMHVYDNVEYKKEQCHSNSNHADRKSKHRSKSNRKDRFTNEHDNEQQQESPHRSNHHVEGGGTKVDIFHRIDKTSRPREMDYRIDCWQSPLTGNGTLPRERETPHVDSNHGETKHKNNSRSNGKLRPGRVTYEPDRVTNEPDNSKQERSPCKRNYQVEGETRFESYRRGKESYEIENWQASPKNNGFLPDYGNETHKKHRGKMHSLNKNYENANTMDLSADHSSAHMLQKGRKQHVRKQRFEETQEETGADHSELVVPEKGSSSCIHVNDKRKDSKCPERQRDRNLQLMENPSTVANIETCWDLAEERKNEAVLEPCIDGERLPGDHGHVRHRRLARKHNQDHANFKVKNLDWDAESKPGRCAEDVVNVQTHRLCYSNGPDICEDGSNYVAQRERAHFPQWHHQFDPIPQGREGAVEAKSFPQVIINGMKKEQKHPENLDAHEDILAKLTSCNGVEGNSSQSRFSKPPQRPPPPVPPYRVSSMPNRKPLDSPPAMAQRCATLETSHVRENQEPHVHPKLPEYEDLVASFAALRNKPARPPAY